MKNIIPIMLAIALINMSCGKSKKEEPVTIEQENQNIDFMLEVVSLRDSKTVEPIVVEINIVKIES